MASRTSGTANGTTNGVWRILFFGSKRVRRKFQREGSMSPLECLDGDAAAPSVIEAL